MLYFAPFVLVQCLGALLAWALIAHRGIDGPTLTEAAAVWLLPLLVAGVAGLSADTLVRIASCGVIFNLANWVWQGVLHRSD